MGKRGSGVFERELKHILQGDPEVIRRVSRGCNAIEKDNYQKIIQYPFIVLRAAGSFGVDLVAVRGDISFPIEVKSSSSEAIRFSDSSGRAEKQARDMAEACERSRVIPVYAYRIKKHKGDSWRVYTLTVKGLKGPSRIVYNRMPKVSESRNGNLILKWSEGMPLNKFVEYICMGKV